MSETGFELAEYKVILYFAVHEATRGVTRPAEILDDIVFDLGALMGISTQRKAAPGERPLGHAARSGRADR